MVYAIEVTSNGMAHTKFHDDRFRNSSNIKDITSTVLRGCRVDTTDERGFLKHGTEMASGGMIYILSLMTMCSGI
jgi:hypothetical protein